MFDEAHIESVFAHYREHGWARLGLVAREEELVLLRQRVDDLMLGHIKYPGMFFQIDTITGNYDDLTYGRGYEGPSTNYRKIEKLELDPLFWSWIKHPVFTELAKRVYGERVSIYRSVLFNKANTGGTRLPWHQDGGKFWGIDRQPELQVWMALDDAPIDAGCVEVFPGSHHAGLVTELGGVVPPNHVEAREPEKHSVLVPAKAGEVVLIHNHTWHRSGVNTTGRTRRALTICYAHGDTKCLRTKRAPRVFPRVV